MVIFLKNYGSVIILFHDQKYLWLKAMEHIETCGFYRGISTILRFLSRFNEERPIWRSWLHQFTTINTEKVIHKFNQNVIVLFMISTGPVNEVNAQE